MGLVVWDELKLIPIRIAKVELRSKQVSSVGVKQMYLSHFTAVTVSQELR